MSSTATDPQTPSPSHETDSSDPWEPAGIVRRGLYTGARLDTDHFRSASLLSPQEARAFAPATDELLVANFRHEERWYIARLRLQAIEDLIFHLEWTGDRFPGVHNQLRVQMKDGGEVTLEPQRPGDEANPARLRNIVLSSEGNYAPGTTPRLHRGLEQASIAHMAMSMEQKAAIMCAGGAPHRVIQMYLDLMDQQKRLLVLTYLRHATEVGTDEMFNLLTWNCASPLFQAIDRTVPYASGRSLLALVSPTFMPHWAPANLRLRGVLDEARTLPNYFDEFPVRTEG